MNPEMSQIGEIFRKKREEMALSLKEVENAIYIRKTFLQAIEEGTIEQFIANVYALGFVKQYAHFLDMDTEKLLQDHPKAFSMEKVDHKFSYGIGTLEMRGSLGGGIKWLSNLLWSMGAASVIILAYYFSKAIGLL